MKSLDLKSCPFCGSNNIKFNDGAANYSYPSIDCENCGAEGPYIEDDDGDKVKVAWNKRRLL